MFGHAINVGVQSRRFRVGWGGSELTIRVAWSIVRHQVMGGRCGKANNSPKCVTQPFVHVLLLQNHLQCVIGFAFRFTSSDTSTSTIYNPHKPLVSGKEHATRYVFFSIKLSRVEQILKSTATPQRVIYLKIHPLSLSYKAQTHFVYTSNDVRMSIHLTPCHFIINPHLSERRGVPRRVLNAHNNNATAFS